MKRLAAIALLWVLSGSLALAQSPIIQSGYVTPGHPLMVITNGVAGDGGTAAQGKLTGLGTTGSGPTICANSGPVTGPYNQICLGVTTTGGGQLSLQNVGGATGALQICTNGSCQALGIADFTAPAHQWVNGFLGGVPTTSQPTTSDISGLGTMALQNANAVDITGGAITGMPSPTFNTDVATKQYVDANTSGLIIHNPAVLATAAALPTYTWSATGGGRLTATSNGQLTVDGVGLTNGQRILVKDELNSQTACNGNVNSACDGTYDVTTAGDGSNPYVLTRSAALNSQGNAENTAAGWPSPDTILITGGGGSVNNNTSWVNTAKITTLNQTSFLFTQTGAGGTNPWQISGPNIFFSGGNVGIGTSSPANPLSVVGAGSFTGNLAIGGNLALTGTVTSGTWNGTPIANAFLANSATTVNGTTCTLGSTCSLPAPTVLGTVVTGTWNATPIANAFLANASTTVNGTTCTLGSTCTPTASVPTAGGRLVAAANPAACATALAVQQNNVSSGTAVCYIPFLPGQGNLIWVNGTTLTYTRLTLTLNGSDQLAAKAYGVFIINVASAATVCASGATWTGTPLTTPGDALTLNANGLYQNTNSITHCYNSTTDYGPITAGNATSVGQIYMSGNGTVNWDLTPAQVNGGTNNILSVYNNYNRKPVFVHEWDSLASSGGSITVNTAANACSIGSCYSLYNASVNNSITWIDGLGATGAGSMQVKTTTHVTWNPQSNALTGGGALACPDYDLVGNPHNCGPSGAGANSIPGCMSMNNQDAFGTWAGFAGDASNTMTVYTVCSSRGVHHVTLLLSFPAGAGGPAAVTGGQSTGMISEAEM